MRDSLSRLFRVFVLSAFRDPPSARLAACVAAYLVMVCAAKADQPAQAVSPWHAGLATVKITPSESMWMAGYASRDKPSEGVAQELFAKALALRDERGQRLVIVTSDLIGIPRVMRDSIEAKAAERFDLPRESLLFNASHTHCGPEVRPAKVLIYGASEERAAVSRAYAAELEDKLVDLVGKALDDLKPATLEYTHARCGFAMNRRRPTDAGFKNSPFADGPVDHNVPVLVVKDRDGAVRGLLFGYACHNTTLSFYLFCGDYAGYAQEYLEAAHPGATAMFLNGTSGDQNPYPRRTIELARQHGRALANAVESALESPPTPIRGPLTMRYEDVTLDFAAPSIEQFRLRLQSPREVEQRHAERMVAEYERSGELRQTYDYPVQAVAFGRDLLLVALAGEVVVDYSLRLKRELAGPIVWVAGYSNDVFGYVPSRRVLEEGGYEGGEAMLHTNLPGPFANTVEQRIVAKVRELTDHFGF